MTCAQMAIMLTNSPKRRQGGDFFHGGPEHRVLQEHRGNDVLFLFFRQWRVVGQFDFSFA